MNDQPDVISVTCRLNAYLAMVQEEVSHGQIGWKSFGHWLVSLLYLACESLDQVTNMSGPEKRDLALTSVGKLFDCTADLCVPLTWRPVWLMLRTTVRTIVLAMAAGAIDALLKISRS